ncbi:hypothetical protein IMCC3317_44440 [Kordia antarctica]|uniref:Uncharacterized protein n=1 Tax=Kordia antarctica TaxID=1218801 RepID=A0A7L4ZUC6_9FLAO|nr:hypothetical protein [Kordia antarctica]QHI39044.1 hypothetical protein IMCC3317_44440 [Kordia antarctica]
MKKTVKYLSMIALAFAFLLSGCTSDQEATQSNEENAAKSELPIIEADWVEIGYIKDGMPYITFDTKKALNTLSENMKKYANIDENYTSVYVASIDEDYNLLFEGKTYRTSFYVKAIKSTEKLATEASYRLVVARKITCTTSECSHEATGCAVKYDPDNLDLPYCSPCANGGKCTKTDISNSDAVATGVF